MRDYSPLSTTSIAFMTTSYPKAVISPTAQYLLNFLMKRSMSVLTQPDPSSDREENPENTPNHPPGTAKGIEDEKSR